MQQTAHSGVYTLQFTMLINAYSSEIIHVYKEMQYK